MRTIKSTMTGSPIPVTTDLNVKPLLSEKKPVVNGNGKTIMDDDWVLIRVPGRGGIPMNINRAQYCAKVYLQHTKILDSISKPPSDNLKRFMSEVADTLVFVKNGTSYRVYLHEVNKKMEIQYVWPYWASVYFGSHGSRPWETVIKKYGTHPGWPGGWDGNPLTHPLNVDLKTTFDFE